MSHKEQMMFFKSVMDVFPELSQGRILDVGSFDINGGPHKLLNEPLEYVGVDVGPGPNVNLVSGGQDLDLPSNYFDIAMSSECFEHNPYWIATFQNMIRMTKPGGVVAFSCATVGRPEHGTSNSDGGHAAPAAVRVGQEFYRNVTVSNLAHSFEESQFEWYTYYVNWRTSDLYFVGVKGSPKLPQAELVETFGKQFAEIENYSKLQLKQAPLLNRVHRFLLGKGLLAN